MFNNKNDINLKVYFSDFFDVAPELLEEYGAFNISLINDLPLFIDPFLLFNSKNKIYQDLHKEILKYITFLRDKSVAGSVDPGLLRGWYCFPEIKQTWLGYSKLGNKGKGPGIVFARALDQNFRGVFKDFDKQQISAGNHIEKLCIIKENIGKDNISDFVTNLIKGFLFRYTEKFAKKFISKNKLKSFPVSHVAFNYKTETWTTESFDLPCYDNEYVLLTPKDILTKDDTWINKSDLFEDFQRIVDSVSNETLRSQLNNYFISNLPKPKKTKSGKEKEPTKSEIFAAINAVLNKYPELIDYYIKYKEENGDKAISVSQQKVEIVETIFIHMLSGFIRDLKKQTGFFVLSGDTLDESYKRALFLKNVIENKDGYRIFYINGSPIKREEDIQIMFRLTWYASDCDVTREANEGRGPVDYKVSRGAADKTLIEFKLASNKKLKQNLQFQVAIYQQAHDTNKKVIVILFFTAKEEQRTKKILQELGLDNEKYIVLIDARNDNKPSASKAKSK